MKEKYRGSIAVLWHHHGYCGYYLITSCLVESITDIPVQSRPCQNTSRHFKFKIKSGPNVRTGSDSQRVTWGRWASQTKETRTHTCPNSATQFKIRLGGHLQGNSVTVYFYMEVIPPNKQGEGQYEQMLAMFFHSTGHVMSLIRWRQPTWPNLQTTWKSTYIWRNRLE